MHVIDVILGVFLVAGNLLALPIWWWLVSTPFVQPGRRRRLRDAQEIDSQQAEEDPAS